jgi:hypothetical protein
VSLGQKDEQFPWAGPLWPSCGALFGPRSRHFGRARHAHERTHWRSNPDFGTIPFEIALSHFVSRSDSATPRAPFGRVRWPTTTSPRAVGGTSEVVASVRGSTSRARSTLHPSMRRTNQREHHAERQSDTVERDAEACAFHAIRSGAHQAFPRGPAPSRGNAGTRSERDARWPGRARHPGPPEYERRS